MKRLKIILFLLLFSHAFEGQIFFDGWRIDQNNPPSSGPNLDPQGYGKNANGADAGDAVITVTNTNTSGAGSLAAAIAASTSHRKIVFSIAGAGPHVIADDFTITNMQYVTIDGTGEIIVIDAPNTCSSEPCGDGFSLEGTGTHHVIIKNLHFRDNQDGLNVVDGAHDIAIMNCAFWENWDGNLDAASSAVNISYQYNVIGNHTNACHCGSGGVGGMLVTTTEVSVHHNLFNPGTTDNPDEAERMPYIHGSYDNAFVDVRNNISYNYGRNNATGSGYGAGIDWGTGFTAGGGCSACYARANVVGNYYYTPSTTADQDGVDIEVDGGGGAEVYSNSNVSGNGFNFNTGIYTNHAEWPVTGFTIEVETACEAVSNILAHVGPDTKHSDISAYISDVTNLGSCAINKVRPPFLDWFDISRKDKEKKNDDIAFMLSSKEAVLPDNRKNKKSIFI